MYLCAADLHFSNSFTVSTLGTFQNDLGWYSSFWGETQLMRFLLEYGPSEKLEVKVEVKMALYGALS